MRATVIEIPYLPLYSSSLRTMTSGRRRRPWHCYGWGGEENTKKGGKEVGGQAAVEGWRAVMSMILRYGAVQKQRLRRFHSTTAHSRSDVPAEGNVPELDQVDQMVEGVKARGVCSRMVSSTIFFH